MNELKYKFSNEAMPTFASPLLYAVSSGGVDVFVNDMACISKECKQYRFPKSKKKRIRKKWSKQRKNFRIQDIHRMIVMKEERKVFVSQKMYDKLKERWQA